MTENGVVTNYTVNAMNQITVWAGQPASYDGNFNFAYMGGWGYTYDAESRLTGLDTGPTPRARFVYDGLGRCVKRTIGTVTTVINYDEWKPIMEWDSPTHWVAWNLYGPGADEILFRSQGGVYLRYHHDIHGNVTALLNYGGALVERYTYDAFGRPTILSASNTQLSASAYGNRFLFQGREYFPELGLYDYRHRFYDPWMGRFLQTDPMGFDAGDMNLFRYCGDDPLEGSDPSGLFDLWGHLKDFYSGNPSIAAILAAWNADLIRSVTKAQATNSAAQKAKRAYKALMKWTGKVRSSAVMTSQFVTGKGPADREFEADSAESEDLRSDPVYHAKLKEAQQNRSKLRTRISASKVLLVQGCIPRDSL